jgi:hypothetical protein
VGGRVARKRGLLEPCAARGSAEPVAGISMGDLWGSAPWSPSPAASAAQVLLSRAGTDQRYNDGKEPTGGHLIARFVHHRNWTRRAEFSVHETHVVIH